MMDFFGCLKQLDHFCFS